ncbi:MAG: PQQ-binding-like beta-propeller repeat protein [Caldisericia bacterium]|nr:PQQ-binding-like beta-propeller repeat protein [Caldisericia bacterium]
MREGEMAGRNYVLKAKICLVLIAFFLSLIPIYSIQTSICQPLCDWLMYGKSPDGNRIIQSGCGLSSTNLTKLWETRFRIDNLATPVVWQNKIYQSDGGNLYCINLDDRSVVWAYESGVNVNFTHTIDSGRIYIIQYSPQGDTSKLVCIDALTGSLLWFHQTKTYIRFYIVASDNKTIIRTKDNYYHCFDSKTGEELWNYYSEVNSRPVVINNKLYLPGIKCLDATTGKVVWDKDKEYVLLSPFAIDNDRIYFCSYNTEIVVVCISATTGEKMFEFFWDKISQSRIITSTCSYDNKLFFTTIKGTSETSKNGIICFDLTSKKVLWEIDTGIHKLCPPTFDNGYIITGSDQGQLLFIDQNTGKIVKTYNIGQPISSEIVIASKKLFVITRKAIFCYESQSN